MNFGGVIHLNKTALAFLCGLVVIFILYSTKKTEISTNISPTESTEGKINLRDLLKVAIKAAENGGEKVFDLKDNINIETKGLTKEGLPDRVTTADYLSHCTMIATIRQMFPAVKVISEEEKTSCVDNKSVDYLAQFGFGMETLPEEYVNEADVTIWIDPLDATQEYTEKLYTFVTTMACVVVKGKPVIGVIHKPFSKTTSWAWVDRARSEDLSEDHQFKKQVAYLSIIVSRSHPGKIRRIVTDNFDDFEIVVAAGAGYKALEVATGRADVYLHTSEIKKWDVCSGNAILKALGGKMTDKYGKEIDYGANAPSVNKDGLIGAVHNHEYYVGKMSKV